MNLRLKAIKDFFEPNINDFQYLPLVFLNDLGGKAQEDVLRRFLGEAYYNMDIIPELIEMDLLTKKNSIFQLSNKGQINLYLTGLINKPLIKINSNISKYSQILLMEYIKSFTSEITINLPINETYLLFSIIGVIKGHILEEGDFLEINLIDMNRLIHYSKFEKIKFLFELLDKLNLLTQVFRRRKEGLSVSSISKLKQEQKTRIEIFPHPELTEYNFLSYFPLKLRHLYSHLNFLGYTFYDKDSSCYIPTEEGLYINDTIISNNRIEEFNNINRINNLIAINS